MAFASRVRPRFFDQVGHQTMYAYIGNKHFFTKLCQRNLSDFFSVKNIRLEDQLLKMKFFENFVF